MVRTRRDFLRAAAGSGLVLAGGCLGFPRSSGGEQKKSAGERLNIAVIGVGGRGQANWGAVCEAAFREGCCLPSGSGMTDADVDRVIAATMEVVAR